MTLTTVSTTVLYCDCIIPEVEIAATKPEVIISQIASQVGDSFHVFEDCLFNSVQWYQIPMCAVSPFSESINTPTVKPEVVISHVAAEEEEKFQQLYRYFQGRPVKMASHVTRRTIIHKKLSCCKETARRFVSLNILLSQSRSVKVMRNDTV